MTGIQPYQFESEETLRGEDDSESGDVRALVVFDSFSAAYNNPAKICSQMTLHVSMHWPCTWWTYDALRC